MSYYYAPTAFLTLVQDLVNRILDESASGLLSLETIQLAKQVGTQLERLSLSPPAQHEQASKENPNA